MKKCFLAIFLILSSAFTHADIGKYEAEYADLIGFYSELGLVHGNVDKITAWVETADGLEPGFKLRSLAIDLDASGDLGDLIVKDFDHLGNGTYVGKTQGWIFNSVEVIVTFDEDPYKLRITKIIVATVPDNKATTPQESYFLASYDVGPLRRVNNNPVADIAHFDVNGQKVTVKLLAHKETISGNSAILTHSIKAHWMGHGEIITSFPMSQDAVGFNIEPTTEHPEYGLDYTLWSKLKDGTKGSGIDLSEILRQIKEAN